MDKPKEEQKPSEEAPITLELSDATLSLWRGCKFVGGVQQWGDRMIVKDKLTGAEEDVVIFRVGSNRTVKRLVLHIEMPSGRGSYSFADVDADGEKRLLALHRKFDGK